MMARANILGLRQFQLRHMFVVVGLFGLLFGYAAFCAQRYAANKRVRQVVEAMRGEVVQHGWLDDVLVVDLNESRADDETVTAVANAPAIRDLYLKNTRVTNKCLKDIARLSRIQRLDLSGCPIADDGIVLLSRLDQLEVLYLNDTAITSIGIKELAKCARLRAITLTLSSLNEREVAELRSMMPNVSITEW